MPTLTFSGLAVLNTRNSVGRQIHTNMPAVTTAATFLVDGKDLQALPEDLRPSSDGDMVMVRMRIGSPSGLFDGTVNVDKQAEFKDGKMLQAATSNSWHIKADKLENFRSILLAKLVNWDSTSLGGKDIYHYSSDAAADREPMGPLKGGKLDFHTNSWSLYDLDYDGDRRTIDEVTGFAARLDTLIGYKEKG